MFFFNQILNGLKILLTLGVIQWFLISISLHSLPVFIVSSVIAEDDYDYEDDYEEEDEEDDYEASLPFEERSFKSQVIAF